MSRKPVFQGAEAPTALLFQQRRHEKHLRDASDLHRADAPMADRLDRPRRKITGKADPLPDPRRTVSGSVEFFLAKFAKFTVVFFVHSPFFIFSAYMIRFTPNFNWGSFRYHRSNFSCSHVWNIQRQLPVHEKRPGGLGFSRQNQEGTRVPSF